MHGAGDIDGATINVDATAEISVSLNSNLSPPDNDPIGEADHAVLMYGTAQTYINVADKFLFDMGAQYAGVMHWDIRSETEYQVHAMVSAGVGFDLAGLQEAIPDSTIYGKLLKKLMAGFDADASLSLVAQVCRGI